MDHQSLPTPHIDPTIDPALASHLLGLARAEIGDLPVQLAKVGYSDLRTSETFSITALIVAAPLIVLAERRFGRADEAADVVQSFPIGKIISVASSAGRSFALVEMERIDSTWAGFQVEGPLVSLPMHTTASDLRLGRH